MKKAQMTQLLSEELDLNTLMLIRGGDRIISTNPHDLVTAEVSNPYDNDIEEF